jgi:membrane protease YdiL (CAAX protease family)
VGLPPRPDGEALEVAGSGPKGLPAVGWSFGKALLVGLVTNIVLAQLLVGGIMFAVLGVTSVEDASSGSALVFVSVAADAVWLAGLLVWLYRWHPAWRRQIGVIFGRRGARDGVWGGIVGVFLYPTIAFAIGIPLTLLFQSLSGEEATTPDQLPKDLSSGAVVASIVLAILIAPVVEELFFRGIVFRSVRDRKGFWIGALVSGVLFGLVHYIPAAWQDTVLLQTIMVFTGIGLAWIYERRGNLVANVCAHMVFNTIGIVLIFWAR